MLYYLVPGRTQWMILLGASFLFYFLAATPYTFIYVAVCFMSVWLAACRIEVLQKRQEKRAARCWYVSALLLVVGLLAALKYANFVLGNVSALIRLFSDSDIRPDVHFLASLGISFYTLQMVGYLTDVYWGITESQKNPAKLLLFNIYFPQMISGPISRYGELKNQLYVVHPFETAKIRMGIYRILLGFFKKLVVSQQLIGLVDGIYGEPAVYNGLFVWIGTFLYVIQIYADFSGCMDIIMGASQCFGIELPENFKLPFTSESIQEFWQRWHITLGAWLKDYIMYPLLRSKAWSGLTKRVKKRFGKQASKQLPVFLAMLVLWLAMGLWHGGGWNYIGEGIWFWLVIVLGQVLKPCLQRLGQVLHIRRESRLWHDISCARTTLIYAVGALFFKAGSLPVALRMLGSACNPAELGKSAERLLPELLALDERVGTVRLCWSVISVLYGFLMMILLGKMEKRGKTTVQWMEEKPVVLRYLLVGFFLCSILLFGAYGPGYSASEFIYGGF